jgi:hypothetical protein
MGAFIGASPCFLRSFFQILILAGQDLFLVFFHPFG